MYRTKFTPSGIEFPADISFNFATPEIKEDKIKEVKLDYKFINGEHDINTRNVEVLTNSRNYAGDNPPYSLTLNLGYGKKNHKAIFKIKIVEHFVKSKFKQINSKEWKGEKWFDGDIEDEGFKSKLKKYDISTTMRATIPINDDDNTWNCNIKDTGFTNIFENNKVDLPLFDETFARHVELNCVIHLKSIFLFDKIGFSRPSEPQDKLCICNWEFKNIEILPKTSFFDSINLSAFISTDDSVSKENSVSLDDSDVEE